MFQYLNKEITIIGTQYRPMHYQNYIRLNIN